jgi:hypothetical protein
MHESSNQSAETLECLRLGQYISKVVNTACLDRVGNSSRYGFPRPVVRDGNMILFQEALRYSSILHDYLVVTTKQTHVLNLDSETWEHVPESDELLHSVLHRTEFRTVSSIHNLLNRPHHTGLVFSSGIQILGALSPYNALLYVRNLRAFQFQPSLAAKALWALMINGLCVLVVVDLRF